MAEAKAPRGKEPVPRKQDPVFSHSPDDDVAGGEGAPVVLRRPAAKSKKKKSWFQENRTLAIGLAGGVGVLVIVLLLGFAFGLFGTGDSAKPSAAPSPTVAAQPAAPPSPSAAPSQPATASSQPTPSQPALPTSAGFSSTAPPPAPSVQSMSLGQPTAPGQPTSQASQDAKKDEPKKEQKPPLPEDVTKWKKGDYLRARRENDAKLLPAIVQFSEKHRGNEKAAQFLVELLKPLPSEKPPVDTPPSAPGTPVMPASGPPRAQGRLPPPSFGGAQPPNPGANPNPGPRPYSPDDLTKLVETIIEALGCNGSGLARGTLEQVLAGTFATDDDKTAVEATLKTLMAHPSEESDALLLRVLTAAKDLRSADHQGPWPAKDLEAKALELVKQSASIGLRTKLAGVAISGHAKFDPKDPTIEYLLAANPLNCGAQLLFYEKAEPKKNKELRTTLEQQFADYSSEALARCLGISAASLPATGRYQPPVNRPAAGGFNAPAARPMGGGFSAPPVRPLGGGFSAPPVRPGGGGFNAPPVLPPAGGGPVRPDEPAKAGDVDLGPQLAGQLWSDQFRKLIEPQVAELRSFDKQPQLVVLAATIPEDSTRAVLYKLLKKHWNDGPKALETAGLTGQVVTDPGLLPIIKMSGARKESPSTPRAADPATGRRGRGPGPAAPAGGGRNEAAQKKQEAERDWMDVSARLASGWCKRFGAAEPAKDGGETSDKPAGDAGDFKLPSGFELPSAARIVASHRVVLPGTAPANFSQVQPSTLEVYYVRAEESARPKKAIAYYSRQALARPADARTFEGKTWIESLRPAPQKDRRRSVDVLITRPEGVAAAAIPEKGKEKAVAEDEVDMTIEVLIIEIKDPTRDPTRESTKE